MNKGKPQMPKSALKSVPTGNPGTKGPKPTATSKPVPTGNQGTRGIKLNDK